MLGLEPCEATMNCSMGGVRVCSEFFVQQSACVRHSHDGIHAGCLKGQRKRRLADKHRQQGESRSNGLDVASIVVHCVMVGLPVEFIGCVRRQTFRPGARRRLSEVMQEQRRAAYRTEQQAE